MTHICVSKLTIIGSDNGLSPGRRQAITWTNVGILLIGPLGTNFSEMLIEIHTFSFKKIHLKMSSAKWRPFCLDLNVLSSPPIPLPGSRTNKFLEDTGILVFLTQAGHRIKDESTKAYRWVCHQAPALIKKKRIFRGKGIPIMKIRWSWDCLIFYNRNSFSAKMTF